MNLDGLTLRTLAFLIVEEIRKHSFHFFTAEQVAELQEMILSVLPSVLLWSDHLE